MEEQSEKSRGRRREQHAKTIRKSRRLALKRRREANARRISDVLGMTPRRSPHVNLSEASAEQVAVATALQYDQQERNLSRKKSGKKGKAPRASKDAPSAAPSRHARVGKGQGEPTPTILVPRPCE